TCPLATVLALVTTAVRVSPCNVVEGAGVATTERDVGAGETRNDAVPIPVRKLTSPRYSTCTTWLPTSIALRGRLAFPLVSSAAEANGAPSICRLIKPPGTATLLLALTRTVAA